MPPAAATTGPAPEDVVLLRNNQTGATVEVPKNLFNRVDRVSELRKRIRQTDVQAAWASDEQITVDAEKNLYRFQKYPPLGFLANVKLFIIVGAFLMVGFTRAQFFFPCTAGSTALTWHGASYCVLSSEAHRVTDSTCPADVCGKRVPVTLQTYGALLNGALAGRTGALATLLYVAMISVGAPFSSDGSAKAVWDKGALIGSTGGFLVGMVMASFIMGKCAEAGHDRPRSIHKLVLWLLGAEAAIYICGLFWMPFGMAIGKGLKPSDICPDFQTPAGANKCFANLANWGFTPFIPGELVKMLMVVLTVPLAWWLLLGLHARFGGRKPVPSTEAGSTEASPGDIELGPLPSA